MAVFLMDEGDGSEDLRQGFDYQAQADGSTPVPSGQRRRGNSSAAQSIPRLPALS